MLISPSSFSSPLVLTTAGFFSILFLLGLIHRTAYHYAADAEYVRPAHPKQYLPVPPKPKQIVYPEVLPIVPPPGPVSESKPPSPPKRHPIDELIEEASGVLDRMLDGNPNGDIRLAAKHYRARRGRHPPPGFDDWLEYAKSKDSLLQESLFDQIYQDIEPFWSLHPTAMRINAADWPFLFSIRNGEVRTRNARLVSGEWLDYWGDMFKELQQYLPDVDIPVNQIDESRIIVGWDKMRDHMEQALSTRDASKPSSRKHIISRYPSRKELDFAQDSIPLTGLNEDGPVPSKETMWNLTRNACMGDTAGRNDRLDNDVSTPPTFFRQFPPHTRDGYISNWTESKMVCHNSHLRNMIGTFVNPRYTSINTTLFPLFGGSKIAGINNEILLPAAKYLSAEEEFTFTGKDVPWEEKKNGLFWRGQATGGSHKAENWKRFHRHRFVAMLNATFVTSEERSIHRPPPVQRPMGGAEIKGAFAGVDPSPPNILKDPGVVPPHIIPLPSPPSNPYNLSALKTIPETTLGRYLASKTNVGFDHLMCHPWIWSILGDGQECGYMNAFYSPVERVTMEEMFSYKYLPDVDGNSYSGRYRAFLSSGSLPLKATIWSEWHDSRLVPWKHFVPIDNTYSDLWGVLEYFWGYGVAGAEQDGGPRGDEQFREGGFREGENVDSTLAKAGHDAQAKQIAEAGREWAAKVLRREDMLVYVYRLMLEYARVVSNARDQMSYVDDLFEGSDEVVEEQTGPWFEEDIEEDKPEPEDIGISEIEAKKAKAEADRAMAQKEKEREKQEAAEAAEKAKQEEEAARKEVAGTEGNTETEEKFSDLQGDKKPVGEESDSEVVVEVVQSSSDESSDAEEGQ